MLSQLPFIPPTAVGELLVHSESLPIYRARPDVSNQTSDIGSSPGTKDREPVVAEIKSLTGTSAIQVNDEPPSKPAAARKGKSARPAASGSKLRATKAPYSAVEPMSTAAVERRPHPLYAAETGPKSPPLANGSVRPLSGNQGHSAASYQLDLRQEQIFLYEKEESTSATVVFTDGAASIKTEARRKIVTKKSDVISHGVAPPTDLSSTVAFRDHSSATPADVIQINRPELVTSSGSVHHVFADVIDPEKTQLSRATNTESAANLTESSSSINCSARTGYEELASFAAEADGAANATTTGPSTETRGEISGRSPGMTRGDVAALSAGCALCLCVCLLLLIAAFRYRRRSKEKRKKPVLDDVVNPSLLEEIIRVELARGRVKMYRTAITDTRELERLPLGGGPGGANDQWGMPTTVQTPPPAKLHGGGGGGEVPGASTTRHSYRPLFSDSPVRIYDLGQAKWGNAGADPDLVTVRRPWNTSCGGGDSGSRQSPGRSEHLQLKTLSFPGRHAQSALPVDAVLGSHVTRSNESGGADPLNSYQRSIDDKAPPNPSVAIPFAPFAPPHTSASADHRCIVDGATVDNQRHRKRFPKMGQSCLLNRRSHCGGGSSSNAVAAPSTNLNVPRSSVISAVVTSSVVEADIRRHPVGGFTGQTIISSNPGPVQLRTKSKQNNAGSLLFVAKGNNGAPSARQSIANDEKSAQNEILWRNDGELLSHLQSSPIYVNTHLPTILSRDTAV